VGSERERREKRRAGKGIEERERKRESHGTGRRKNDDASLTDVFQLQRGVGGGDNGCKG
jgi:hypothetical protein